MIETKQDQPISNTQHTLLTAEDLRELPDDGCRYETEKEMAPGYLIILGNAGPPHIIKVKA